MALHMTFFGPTNSLAKLPHLVQYESTTASHSLLRKHHQIGIRPRVQRALDPLKP